MQKPAMHVRLDPLPYAQELAARNVADIDLVVIHCTELPDLASAREYGERVLYRTRSDGDGTGNSGHFYIDRDGSAHGWVAIDRIAHHTRGYNPRSIGIELINTGRYPHWLDSRHQTMAEPYPEAQLEALTDLLNALCRQLPDLHLIAGHEDLDNAEVEASDDPALRVRRKCDPGPMFPWPRLLAAVPLHRLVPE